MIAPFRWWHIEPVLLIEDELFGAERWTAPMFWNELAAGHYYRVFLSADDVVGYAGLAVSPPDEAWINNVGVRRDAQRRGVGRALVDDLHAEASRVGAKQILLEVAADNEPAQHLYASYGFEVIGRRRGYYQPSNTDALVMSHEL
ncbi:ribosomal protein S18-alanine N-acetyltransferase [Luedemannella flava]|uniref:[Ribosomal protein bS18]-alanine N-acetyltransferase n=1 Tax=Luedemannella flava TaxID=349316 RepID=A0ABP4XVI7_9ACTN